MIGQKLNKRYTITARLGEGGMGEVFQATDEQTGQQVAVKVLTHQLTAHPESLERFRREAETLRQLDHPNIVKFLDAFEHDGHYVIVMEYMPGGSLFDLLQQGALPIARARRIALELCDALIRSHHLSIIHRDIKPENVLLLENGTPKLADFGVARLSEGTRMTRSGTQVGTPYYMAPEAWEGKMLDAQADIWSLGVLLFEMLAGQVPFNGDTPLAIMNKVCTTPPPDLKKLRVEAPNSLVKIVNRMITRDKKRRYETMRQVGVDLESDQKLEAPAKPASLKRSFHLRWWHWGLIIFVGLLAITITVSRAGLVIKQTPEILSSPTAIIASTQPVTPIATNTATPGVGSTMLGKDGMTMLFVPAGKFTMGSDSGDSDEKPVGILNLDAFWVDQTEITNRMYAQCERESACEEPTIASYTRSIYYGDAKFDLFPMISADWDMAKSYCEWAGRRLPTEAEWEKAARSIDARTYPWGDESPNAELLNFNTNIGDTTKVGSYEAGKSFYGAYDMAGNVWEWTSSLYRPYPYDAKDGRENPSSSESRVLRGGSWGYADNSVRSANRNFADPSISYNDAGIRCASSLP